MEKLHFEAKPLDFGLLFEGVIFYSVLGKTSGTPKARPFFGTKSPIFFGKPTETPAAAPPWCAATEPPCSTAVPG
jgi:hypothetical protein